MAALSVGQGLWDYVVAHGDQPTRDSKYIANKNGSQIEEVWGSKGYYYCSNATGVDGTQGAWECYGPFGGSTQE